MAETMKKGGGALPAMVRRVTELALEKKGGEVLALDLRSLSSATDWFILASGASDIQVKAIAEHILDELRKEGVRAQHVEGLGGGNWVLLDYFDVVVHVLHRDAREFYQLEGLWGDAPRHEFGDEG